MAITDISRDWGISPQIVRISTDDTLATITASGYLASQAEEIELINKGEFQWVPGDAVLVSYENASGALTSAFFVYDTTLDALLPAGAGVADQVLVPSAQILTMGVTPVNIIPAPGEDRALVLYRIWGQYTYGGTQYAAGGAISLRWDDTTLAGGPAASSTLAAATFNGWTASNCFDLTVDGTDTLANIENAGIYLSNDTANFTTGNGSLRVNVLYTVVPTA